MTTYYKRNKLGGSISIFTKNDIGEQTHVATVSPEGYMLIVNGISNSRLGDKLFDEDANQFVVGTIGDLVA